MAGTPGPVAVVTGSRNRFIGDEPARVAAEARRRACVAGKSLRGMRDILLAGMSPFCVPALLHSALRRVIFEAGNRESWESGSPQGRRRDNPQFLRVERGQTGTDCVGGRLIRKS